MSFYETTGSKASGSDHRRKWDADEFEQKAKERLRVELEEEEIKSGKRTRDEPKIKRELLQARDYKVDLDSKVGKAVVINKTTSSAESGGFYCNVCDCVVKDSLNFLDHVNGKNHQRNLGMSMKVKKSTVDEVRDRFALKKAERERDIRQKELEMVMADVNEEEAKMTDARKERKQERKRKREPEVVEEDNGELDPELQAMMGFGGFGGSKK